MIITYFHGKDDEQLHRYKMREMCLVNKVVGFPNGAFVCEIEYDAVTGCSRKKCVFSQFTVTPPSPTSL